MTRRATKTARWVWAVRVITLSSGISLIALLVIPSSADASEAPVGLGTAATYSVLGGQTVTNTGATILSGDLGVSPGTAFTGFPPGTVGGATHAGDAEAAKAQADLTIAYDDAAGRAPTAGVAGDLVGQTLTTGVYKSTSTLELSGTLTLDGQGDPNAVFIFQVASALTTASSSKVSVINGADACNVYWQIGSSAVLGTTSAFIGTIMALTSITVPTNTVVTGRALARNGSVTLDNDSFLSPACTAPTTTTVAGSTTTSGATTTTIPGATTTTVPGATTTSTIPGATTTTTIPGATTTTTVPGTITTTTTSGATTTTLPGATTTTAGPNIPEVTATTQPTTTTTTRAAAAPNTTTTTTTSQRPGATTTTALGGGTTGTSSGSTGTSATTATTTGATGTFALATTGPNHLLRALLIAVAILFIVGVVLLLVAPPGEQAPRR
ncbi:MAG: hypothetical protein QOF30_2373 [Acidimicrobiaceae bacterium]|nr:hypothetical protein [Acidimicrobiaceae bacterium]